MKSNIPPRYKWTQKDGVVIDIREMKDSHLNNCIKLLKRKTEELKRTLPYPMFNEEMAQFFAEQDYDRIMEADVEDLFPVYRFMIEEQERRSAKLYANPSKRK